MKRLLILIILAFALAVPAGHVAANPACSCTPWNLCTEVFHTEAIFAAHILSIEPFEGLLRVRMEVFIRFKGVPAPGDTISVLTGTWDGDCGVNFTYAPDYLVFASGPFYPPPGYDIPEGFYGTYDTNLCSRTRGYNPNDPIIPFLTGPCPTPTQPTTWSSVKSRVGD